MAFKDIVESLNRIAQLAKSADVFKVREALVIAIQTTRKSELQTSEAHKAAIKQLETELSTWDSKLETILKEPAGRQGMVKHANHWAERLKGI